MKILNIIPQSERRITLATVFTLMRIFLTPLLVIAIVKDQWVVASFLFVIAGITDWLDGFLARYLNQKTLLGAWLDPIADKILLLSCFIALWYSAGFFPLWLIIFVVGKEIIQVLGAAWLYSFYQWSVVEPTFMGKAATAVQLLIIGGMLYYYCFNYPLPTHSCYIVGILCLCVSASLFSYVLVAIKIIKKERKRIV